MRTTTRIEPDLMHELKEAARKENSTFTKVLNRAIRAGLKGPRGHSTKRPPYREKTFAMGKPRIDLTKALAIAAVLEDEEVLRKASLRK